jgi:hypothetical protein
MIVPRKVLLAPMEAVPVGTQKTLELEALALPVNATIIVFAEVNAPEERKTYTPGVLKLRLEPTDIAPETQCVPGASAPTVAKSVEAA